MGIEFHGMAPLLQVYDMPTALRFYRDTLGFEVVTDSGQGDDSGWVWLRGGDVDLMLNTAYEAGARPSAPEPGRRASHSDTGLYFSCQALDDAYEHLKRQGVSPEPPKVAPYGMRQLYLTDPDGYVVCFQWPANNDSGAR